MKKARPAFFKGSGGFVITACITLHGRSEKRMEILQTIKGIKEQLDKKTRCRQVKIYQDIDDENTFFLVEDWLSEHDLDEYLSSGLFKVLLGLNPILEEPLEVKVFVCEH
jgi:quinol monooxygenase YgiN